MRDRSICKNSRAYALAKMGSNQNYWIARFIFCIIFVEAFGIMLGFIKQVDLGPNVVLVFHMNKMLLCQ